MQHEASSHAGRRLVYAAVALIILTIISFGSAFAVDLGSAGTPFALVIAAVKAAIVAAIFMELMRSGPMARITAVVILTFIALLCVGTIGDIAFR